MADHVVDDVRDRDVVVDDVRDSEVVADGVRDSDVVVDDVHDSDVVVDDVCDSEAVVDDVRDSDVVVDDVRDSDVAVHDDLAATNLHAPLKVGDEYNSYEQLEKAIKALEKLQNINFWIRDSRSITAAKRRINFIIRPVLKYYEVKYACIKGDRPFQSKSTGARPNQR